MSQKPILMYSTPWCPYCIRAKQLLEKKGLSFTDFNVSAKPELRRQMIKKAAGASSVPQIWIGERHVGGCDELYALERSGSLDKWLS